MIDFVFALLLGEKVEIDPVRLRHRNHDAQCLRVGTRPKTFRSAARQSALGDQQAAGYPCRTMHETRPLRVGSRADCKTGCICWPAASLYRIRAGAQSMSRRRCRRTCQQSFILLGFTVERYDPIVDAPEA